MGKSNDITGKKFGRLTVIEKIGNVVSPNGNSTPILECICDCGNKVVIRRTSLVSGNTKSCGCLRVDNLRDNKIINKRALSLTDDLVGQKFGKLIVIKQTEMKRKKSGKTVGACWLCQCDCGNTRIVIANNLRAGRVKSCGCTRGI